MHLNALLKPLHPNISIDILLVVLSTFPKVLIRRIVKQSRASLVGDHYSNSCHLNVLFRGDIVRRHEVLVTLWGQRFNRCLFIQLFDLLIPVVDHGF